MKPRLPRWLGITLLVLLVVLVLGAAVYGIVRLVLWNSLWGGVGAGLLLAILALLAYFVARPLWKLYKFQQYFSKHEAQLQLLPSLMQSGRTQEAMMRFEGVMKGAPEDSAYIFYMRAFFLQAAGRLPEAMSAATKALNLANTDPFLPMILQQMGGQMGQPSTLDEFKTQVQNLCNTLEPRVSQMRQRREKATEKRKKKSR